MNLLLVLPVSNADYDLALQSIAWMTELGTKADVLLVKDCKLAAEKHTPLYQAIRPLMKDSITAITAPHYGPDDRWPVGPNWMFLEAARFVERHVHRPWLWCEADAVPLCEGWLEELDAEYASCGKPFMGVVLHNTKVFGKVWPAHMTGVGVYPPDAASRFAPLKLENAKEAWDILGGEIMAPHAHHTRKIVHVWGEQGLPPTFVEARTKGCARNVLTLDQIPNDCRLFHRCKDFTLQRLLKHFRTWLELSNLPCLTS